MKKPITLTVRETQRILRLSHSVLYRAIQSGEIPAIKVQGSWRVPMREVERIVGEPFQPEWLE